MYNFRYFTLNKEVYRLYFLFLLAALADDDNICDAILVLSRDNATIRLNHKSLLTCIEANIGLYGLGYCFETS